MILEEGCTDVYVCGIATDVCVGIQLMSPYCGLNNRFSASTAFHANELGFRTILIDDCSRGIKEENIASTFSKLKTEFACVVQSTEV